MNTLMDVDTYPVAQSGKKPLDDIVTLVTHLSPGAQIVSVDKSQIIHYATDHSHFCYVLHEGSFSLHRRGDGIVMVSESAPFVFGLSGQLAAQDEMYVRALEHSVMSKLSLKEAHEIISSHNLWMHVAKVLIYNTSRVYQHCARIQQLSAYDIIRSQLYELMNETENLRSHTTAANYIGSRTYLARSGIMRILSELKAGGYVVMNNGILIEINHLPKKY